MRSWMRPEKGNADADKAGDQSQTTQGGKDDDHGEVHAGVAVLPVREVLGLIRLDARIVRARAHEKRLRLPKG